MGTKLAALSPIRLDMGDKLGVKLAPGAGGYVGQSAKLALGANLALGSKLGAKLVWVPSQWRAKVASWLWVLSCLGVLARVLNWLWVQN